MEEYHVITVRAYIPTTELGGDRAVSLVTDLVEHDPRVRFAEVEHAGTERIGEQHFAKKFAKRVRTS